MSNAVSQDTAAMMYPGDEIGTEQTKIWSMEEHVSGSKDIAMGIRRWWVG